MIYFLMDVTINAIFSHLTNFYKQNKRIGGKMILAPEYVLMAAFGVAISGYSVLA